MVINFFIWYLSTTIFLTSHTTAQEAPINILAAPEEPVSNLGPPDLTEVPPGLQFSCQDRLPGYYADVTQRCQVWHWCLPSGAKYSFICPPSTVFNQNFRVCDWWFNVDCSSAPDRYYVNEDLYKNKDGVPI